MSGARLDMKMLIALFIAALVMAAAAGASAVEELPVCDAAAFAALKQLPAPAFRCGDSGQYCSTDQGMRWDEAECKEATKAYEKTLKGLLTPQWWAVPAQSLEACRVHGKVGTLTRDEADSLNQGLGEQVQGTDRVRMLVLGDTCEGSGLSNEFLVARSGDSLAVTALYYDFNQGGQEAPFALDVATGKSGTFALFTSQGHDMRSAYSTTTAYKIDPATGYAALYPLFLTVEGPSTQVGQSQPVTGDFNFKDTEMVRNGGLVKQFLLYSDNLCAPDDDRCQPVRSESFSWNGNAFVVSGYEKKRSEYLQKLARQRECVKRKFDPKKGKADCIAELDCPYYNDLAWLNLKAGNLTDAGNYAEGALSFCRANFKEFQAAQYNYRQSHKTR
jgi:hypothetical protein